MENSEKDPDLKEITLLEISIEVTDKFLNFLNNVPQGKKKFLGIMEKDKLNSIKKIKRLILKQIVQLKEKGKNIFLETKIIEQIIKNQLEINSTLKITTINYFLKNKKAKAIELKKIDIEELIANVIRSVISTILDNSCSDSEH